MCVYPGPIQTMPWAPASYRPFRPYSRPGYPDSRPGYLDGYPVLFPRHQDVQSWWICFREQAAWTSPPPNEGLACWLCGDHIEQMEECGSVWRILVDSKSALSLTDFCELESWKSWRPCLGPPCLFQLVHKTCVLRRVERGMYTLTMIVTWRN